MPDQLLPDSFAAQLSDLDRRLRNLEAAPRVGLSAMHAAWGTAAADVTTYGSLDAGPAASTWADDMGNTGTGYPKVSCRVGKRVMLMWGARPTGIAAAATYRSASVTITVRINGGYISLPSPQRLYSNSNAAPVDTGLYATIVRDDFTQSPLDQEFQIMASFANDQPAAANLPRLTDIFLAVIPISPL